MTTFIHQQSLDSLGQLQFKRKLKKNDFIVHKGPAKVEIFSETLI